MSTFGLMKIVREIKQQKATGIKALGIILRAAREEKQELLLQNERKKMMQSKLLKNMQSKFLRVKNQMDLIAGLNEHK